jgi:phosphoglycerol transferase MdoB-like AlkP superfamily enzyme
VLNGGIFLLWGLTLFSDHIKSDLFFCRLVRFGTAANALLLVVAALRRQFQLSWKHLLFAMLMAMLWFGCICLHDYARGFTGH